MLIYGSPAAETPDDAGRSEKAIGSFLRFIEERLGVIIVRDARGDSGDPHLREPLRLASTLYGAGVIKSFGRNTELPDEPRLKSWYAICNNASEHQVAGVTWTNDADALRAALAEALERYVWSIADDYFVRPRKATVQTMRNRGPIIEPERFVGYSNEQRKRRPERLLREDAEYLWVQGLSLISNTPVHLPAQVVSGAWYGKTAKHGREPQIRQTITNGLATWTTRPGAQLAGALEVIEREAYMITWLNQLTLPRFNLTSLAAHDAEIAHCLATCERYRLKVHAIKLLTDAPTHAVAVVLEDESGLAPRYAIGLKAHRSLSHAIQKAAIEALRARRGYRLWERDGGTWSPTTSVETIGHRERLYYWGVPEHAQHLEFLVSGPVIDAAPKPWDSDDIETHLDRIRSWCAEKHIECVSVPLSSSQKNPTHLHIEMVIMPELQPTYLDERLRAFGGTRWKEVPAAFGYTPRTTPFADAPHPFS